MFDDAGRGALQEKFKRGVNFKHTIQDQRHPFPPVADPYTCQKFRDPSLYQVEDDGEKNLYLLVISKVVPKIWARTNSAILDQG